MSSSDDYSHGDLLAFWFGDSRTEPERADAMKQRWFLGDSQLDDQIRQHYGPWIAAAVEGKLADWRSSASGRLALTLLLDNFPRNVFRGTKEAFTSDAAALEVSKSLVEQGLFELSPPEQIFALLPLTHSEELADQELALEVFDRCVECARDEWKPLLRHSREFARDHHNVVARFGRFPHRNAVLERVSTRDEEAFLAEGGDSWGQ